MGRSKKTRADLVAENKLLRQSRNAGTFAIVATSVSKWGGLSLIAFFAYRSLEALAGKATLADIGLHVPIELDVNQFAAWCVGFAGAVYGWSQRELRRSTIARLTDRIKILEMKEDPARSSSGLTKRGETNPEDQP